ncbi:MAG: peptigoglycan-binding protein LysM [Halieaceae bacterium]|nr:peptigoglycan-binding protein LysM [Halieaceae bacterium]
MLSRRTLSLLPLLLVVGCADNPPATIENRSVVAVEEVPEVRQISPVGDDYGAQLQVGADYVVQSGDTLYAVAFRLGMDYRSLADINNIDPPYVIKVSQVLKTAASPGAPNLSPQKPLAATRSEVQSAASEPVAKSSPSAVASSSATDSQRVQTQTPPRPSPPSASMANVPVDRWSWPADGRVSRSFSKEGHKGIDLSGERGAPVRAVAPGVIVYSGTRVTGYGALLIVKHNDTYLSAYGHNDALLVGEGEQVKAGQEIAKMGSTSTDSVKLHFEIRRNGVPVDPERLLPRR